MDDEFGVAMFNDGRGFVHIKMHCSGRGNSSGFLDFVFFLSMGLSCLVGLLLVCLVGLFMFLVSRPFVCKFDPKKKELIIWSQY